MKPEDLHILYIVGAAISAFVVVIVPVSGLFMKMSQTRKNDLSNIYERMEENKDRAENELERKCDQIYKNIKDNEIQRHNEEKYIRESLGEARAQLKMVSKSE